jgi:hypothetical protein
MRLSTFTTSVLGLVAFGCRNTSATTPIVWEGSQEALVAFKAQHENATTQLKILESLNLQLEQQQLSAAGDQHIAEAFEAIEAKKRVFLERKRVNSESKKNLKLYLLKLQGVMQELSSSKTAVTGAESGKQTADGCLRHVASILSGLDLKVLLLRRSKVPFLQTRIWAHVGQQPMPRLRLYPSFLSR